MKMVEPSYVTSICILQMMSCLLKMRPVSPALSVQGLSSVITYRRNLSRII